MWKGIARLKGDKGWRRRKKKTHLARLHRRGLSVEHVHRLDAFLHEPDGAAEQALQVASDVAGLVGELLRALADSDLKGDEGVGQQGICCSQDEGGMRASWPSDQSQLTRNW